MLPDAHSLGRGVCLRALRADRYPSFASAFFKDGRPKAAYATFPASAFAKASADMSGEEMSNYTVAPRAFGRRRCSSSRGMISTKLQGRVR
ncbi:hypothetical protein ACVWWI_005854 [Bradyrhizobium sp. USDA 3686]